MTTVAVSPATTHTPAATEPPCPHREWGHGTPSPRPPAALLTEAERLGHSKPPRWPTPLICMDCGVPWPGVSIACELPGRPRYLFTSSGDPS
jgi:hypothetical protein